MSHNLGTHGHELLLLHGDMDQSARNKAINDFKKGSVRILGTPCYTSPGYSVLLLSWVLRATPLLGTPCYSSPGYSVLFLSWVSVLLLSLVLRVKVLRAVLRAIPSSC